MYHEARALRCLDRLAGRGAVAADPGAWAAARAGPAPRQKLTIAAAMNTLEYVPVMMPTTIVNANPCSTSPPKKNGASAGSSAVPRVIHVRVSVWLIDTWMM